MPISGTPFAVTGNDTNDGTNPTVLSTYDYKPGKFSLSGHRLTVHAELDTRLWTFYIAVCK